MSRPTAVAAGCAAVGFIPLGIVSGAAVFGPEVGGLVVSGGEGETTLTTVRRAVPPFCPPDLARTALGRTPDIR